MDAFESIVAMLLEYENYWVRSAFKVELTKEEKRAIGRPSSPRWELDLVAYRGATNEVLVVECKSYLDSPGVMFKGFNGSDERHVQRYKLFNEEKLRQVVLDRLVAQMVETGLCSPSPIVHLCLAAGHIATEEDRKKLKAYFAQQQWQLFDEEWILERLAAISKSSYENDIATIVTKLVMRNPAFLSQG